MNNELLKTIDEILKEKVVGSSLLIYAQGKTIEHNYGISSLNKNKVVDSNTIFRLASISKVIITIAALKLVEEGKLNLDDDIGNILGFEIRNPRYPKIPITTKMLMLHTSSILDGYDDENLDHDGIEKGYNGVNGKSYFVDLKDLLTNTKSPYYTNKTFAPYSPGAGFTYSNFGSGILACIVEKCSGILFTEYVETNIFKPLKMDASFKASHIKNQDAISDTFYFDQTTNQFKTLKEAKDFINFTYPDFSIGNNFRGPAGGSYMSMRDLNKIMQILMHDGKSEGIHILKKETVDYMLQMHYLGANPEYKSKGLQLKFIDYFDDHILKGHTGLAYGVRSFMFFSKERNFGICFIFNGGLFKDILPDLNDIQYEILKLAVEHFAHKNEYTVIIDDHQNVSIDGRNVILNQYKIINDKLFLSLIDIANVIHVIPKITDKGIFIKNKRINIVDGYIALDEVLNQLSITYLKHGSSYKIQLMS